MRARSLKAEPPRAKADASAARDGLVLVQGRRRRRWYVGQVSEHVTGSGRFVSGSGWCGLRPATDASELGESRGGRS